MSLGSLRAEQLHFSQVDYSCADYQLSTFALCYVHAPCGATICCIPASGSFKSKQTVSCVPLAALQKFIVVLAQGLAQTFVSFRHLCAFRMVLFTPQCWVFCSLQTSHTTAYTICGGSVTTYSTASASPELRATNDKLTFSTTTGVLARSLQQAQSGRLVCC